MLSEKVKGILKDILSVILLLICAFVFGMALGFGGKWILSVILLAIFGFFASVNIYFHWQRVDDAGPSMLPVFGGLLGFVGVLLLPLGTLSDRLLFCWIPVVVDPGCGGHVLLNFITDLWRGRTGGDK
jgi:hypothetical protein